MKSCVKDDLIEDAFMFADFNPKALVIEPRAMVYPQKKNLGKVLDVQRRAVVATPLLKYAENFS